MASPGGGSRENDEHSPRSNVREQDRFLPVANISRIMKKALPPNGKIAKDAKETMQECVSEFISFITSEASEKCQREKRKTINGDDLLWAMATLGFEEYIEPLKLYLQKYREMEGDNKVPSKGADNPGRRETMGLQVINQPGTSTQGEINLPQHSSFAHGMTYMHSQGSCLGFNINKQHTPVNSRFIMETSRAKWVHDFSSYMLIIQLSHKLFRMEEIIQLNFGRDLFHSMSSLKPNI